MTSIYGSSQFSNSFRGTSSYVPLVGVLLNKYENFGDLSQFKYNIASGSGQAVAGDPVTVKNQVGTTANTVAIESFNAVCGEISAKSDAVSNLDGFLLQSPQDVVPLLGGEAFPIAGFLSYVALLGSGAELYLPAGASLADVDYNTRITWDYDNDCLKKAEVGTDIALPIRLKSARVAGKKLTYDTGTSLASWADCYAVRVALDSINQTIESSGS